MIASRAQRRRRITLVAAVIASAFVALSAAHADEPRIASDEFLASPAVTALQAGDNARALRELDALAREYPDDPLILRYRALALIHLSCAPEAITICRQLLLRSPQHVPTHLFLGQVYLRHGDRAAAA